MRKTLIAVVFTAVMLIAFAFGLQAPPGMMDNQLAVASPMSLANEGIVGTAVVSEAIGTSGSSQFLDHVAFAKEAMTSSAPSGEAILEGREVLLPTEIVVAGGSVENGAKASTLAETSREGSYPLKCILAISSSSNRAAYPADVAEVSHPLRYV
ncbi:MAG: hypothetical protein WCW56_00530 [Candidatus Paceibacterota bacterium]|jgi:hypothetical protein